MSKIKIKETKEKNNKKETEEEVKSQKGRRLIFGKKKMGSGGERA